jgi:membrane protease YdiL (CAAX protease family)
VETTDGNREHFRYASRAVTLYFVLAFAITWGILIPALSLVPEDLEMVFIILAAFGPFLSAVITIWTSRGRAELRRWLRQIFTLRIPAILYITGAFLLPIGVGAMHYGLYTVLGGRPDFSEAMPWYAYPIALVATALLTGGNEEPGWRGFALPALLERYRPVMATAILGVIHGAWHLPLMSRYDTSFGWYLFNILPLTVIFNWFYLSSRKSVIPVMLFHAGTNVIGDFFPTPTDVLDTLDTYMFLRGIVYWVVAVVLLIATQGRLGHDPTDVDVQ